MNEISEKLDDGHLDVPYRGGRKVKRYNYLKIMRPGVCASCDKPIQFFAVVFGDPLHAAYHEKCVPKTNLEKRWPHPQPAISYLQGSDENNLSSSD